MRGEGSESRRSSRMDGAGTRQRAPLILPGPRPGPSSRPPPLRSSRQRIIRLDILGPSKRDGDLIACVVDDGQLILREQDVGVMGAQDVAADDDLYGGVIGARGRRVGRTVIVVVVVIPEHERHSNGR
ncbi:hypothetical protein KEM55_007891 [Ascosphaera atra]|nr:hypothetical protein KEM55_007891 [Ascosphaera atra]